MAAVPFKLTTGGSTNLTKVRDFQSTVKGLIAVNTAAYEIFVKLYWFEPTASALAPSVGTTVPDATFAVPALGTTTGGFSASYPDGFSKAGNLYLAVTKLAADSDSTPVVSGDGIITLLVEP